MERSEKTIDWFSVECEACRRQGKGKEESTFGGRSAKEADKNLINHYHFKHRKENTK